MKAINWFFSYKHKTPVKDPSSLGIGLFLLAVFLLMFTLNQLTPLWGDDWYRTGAPGLEFLTRIKDEYFMWTGRLSVLLLTYVFFWMYPGSVVFFNIVNAIVFSLLVLAMFVAATGRRPQSLRKDGATLGTALISIWFFSQGFGETILWKTGAIAYLWVITAAIWLLNPFLSLLSESRISPNSRFRIWCLPFAYLILAMSLENVSMAMFAMMTFAIVRAKQQNLKLPRWYFLAMLGQLVGTLTLLLAPGNFVRMGAQSDSVPMTRRLYDLFVLIWQHGTTITPVFIVIAVLLVLLALRGKSLALPRLWCWFLFGLLLALAMIVSTGVNFQERTAFVSEVCFSIVVVGLVHAYWTNWMSLWALPVTGIALVIFAADVSVTLDQYVATARQEQRREQLMTYYRAANLKNIVLPSTQVPYVSGLRDDIIDKRYFLRDIHMDIPGNGWRNGTYAKYHGFDFALRIDRPYMIFLPEIDDPRSSEIWAKGADFVIFARQESAIWSTKRVMYLFSPVEHCSLDANMTLFPKDPTQLPLTIAVPNRQDVAAVDASGLVSQAQCIARVELPDQEFNRVEFTKTPAMGVWFAGANIPSRQQPSERLSAIVNLFGE